jgi:hypothetical protein
MISSQGQKGSPDGRNERRDGEEIGKERIGNEEIGREGIGNEEVRN